MPVYSALERGRKRKGVAMASLVKNSWGILLEGDPSDLAVWQQELAVPVDPHVVAVPDRLGLARLLPQRLVAGLQKLPIDRIALRRAAVIGAASLLSDTRPIMETYLPEEAFRRVLAIAARFRDGLVERFGAAICAPRAEVGGGPSSGDYRHCTKAAAAASAGGCRRR